MNIEITKLADIDTTEKRSEDGRLITDEMDIVVGQVELLIEERTALPCSHDEVKRELAALVIERERELTEIAKQRERDAMALFRERGFMGSPQISVPELNIVELGEMALEIELVKAASKLVEKTNATPEQAVEAVLAMRSQIRARLES